MDRWKSRGGKSQRREEKRRDEKRREEKKREDQRRDSQKTEDAREKVEVAIRCVFPMIYRPGGSKSRLAKAAGAEPSGQMRDEKLHAVVARSTFRSQKCKRLTVSDYFWKLRCRKAHAVVAQSTFRSKKCTKHLSIGPVLEVEMSKKCTTLSREAHFEVKVCNTHHSRSTFGS